MPDYPRPSLLEVVLFQNPWPGLVVFGLVGLGLGWLALRRRSRRLGIAAALLAAAAGLVPLLSHLVTTPAERLGARSRALVEAVLDNDEAALRALFAEGVTLEAPEGRVHSAGRAELIERVKAAHRKYPLVDARMLGANGGRIDGTRARSRLRVATRHEAGGGDFLSGSEMGALTTWRLEWRTDVEPWRIRRIIWVRLNNSEAHERYIP